MRLTVRLVFQPIWTEQIHDEWVRNVLLNRPDITRVSLERTRDLMNHFGHDWQAPNYEALIPTVVLPDRDDRHVLAAALAAQATVIVTFNLTDFPASVLASYGVEALHPDGFLCREFDRNPVAFTAAIQDLLAALRNPPRTLSQQLEVMRAQGLAQIAERLNDAMPDNEP